MSNLIQGHCVVIALPSESVSSPFLSGLKNMTINSRISIKLFSCIKKSCDVQQIQSKVCKVRFGAWLGKYSSGLSDALDAPASGPAEAHDRM